jgi:hypothetical protein
LEITYGPVKPDPAEGESWCARMAEIVGIAERGVWRSRGMSSSEVERWAWQHGDFTSHPSMEDAFSSTLRAHQLGPDNALRMQRRERARVSGDVDKQLADALRFAVQRAGG